MSFALYNYICTHFGRNQSIDLYIYNLQIIGSTTLSYVHIVWHLVKPCSFLAIMSCSRIWISFIMSIRSTKIRLSRISRYIRFWTCSMQLLLVTCCSEYTKNLDGRNIYRYRNFRTCLLRVPSCWAELVEQPTMNTLTLLCSFTPHY